jgi:hypothetical protein
MNEASQAAVGPAGRADPSDLGRSEAIRNPRLPEQR